MDGESGWLCKDRSNRVKRLGKEIQAEIDRIGISEMEQMVELRSM